jgi:Domain of unknown function (DUF4352)
MQVTVSKVIAPARSSMQFIRPEQGKRFVSLQLANVGSAVYNDSPSNGAVLVDDQSHQYSATIAGMEPDIGSPTIAAGDKRIGLMTFDVPKGKGSNCSS